MTSQDRQQIEETVQRYIDGIANSEPDKVSAAFHAEATMSGHFGGEYRATPGCGQHIADFMKTIPPTSEHSPHFKGSINTISQQGTMAFVAISEDGLQDKDMKTYFLLHKIDNAWLITAKSTWAPD